MSAAANAGAGGPDRWPGPLADDPAVADGLVLGEDPAWWDREPPSEEELCGLIPDPDTDPPDDRDAWLNGSGHPQPPEVLPAGLWLRDDERGIGFGAGGNGDRLVPGPVLAHLAEEAAADFRRLADDEVVGVIIAWRRLVSWATAGELAAVAEFHRRRNAQPDPYLAEHVSDELAVPLKLTSRAADALVGFATDLARLPRTRAALAAADIDRARAWVIADETSCLDAAHAAAVEAAVVGKAPCQTSGQVRAAARRAVLAADPTAAGHRAEQARKDARVEVWDERSGTAAIAGRDLPPAQVVAADKRLTVLARHLQTTGHAGTLAQLRAHAYTALLLGQPLGTPPTATAGGAGTPAAGTAPAAAPGNVTTPAPAVTAATAAGTAPNQASPQVVLNGSVNLTMPLATWLGASHAPGEAAGYGPLPAADARALATTLATHPTTRWCLTFTDTTSRAIAHGCATIPPTRNHKPAQHRPPGQLPGQPPGHPPDPPGPQPPAGPPPTGLPPGWALTVTLTPLAGSDGCDHARESAGYRPSPSLRHLITIRHRTCSFPTCRRPATACDLDHTLAYHHGGRTCECGLAPLCRKHHRAKQAHGWRLDQPTPGTLIWTLPNGRRYRAEPDPYPAHDPTTPNGSDPTASDTPPGGDGLSPGTASRPGGEPGGGP